MKKILMVEDAPVIIAGLEYLLSKQGLANYKIEVVASLGEIKGIITKKEYQLVIFGLRTTTIQLDNLLHIAKQFVPCPVLLFVEDAYSLPLKKIYNAGIQGVLDKKAKNYEIIEAIQNLMDGGYHLSTPIFLKLLSPPIQSQNKPSCAFDTLTNRELEIARLLMVGQRNLQIGTKLELKPNTVSTFKTRIFSKLQVNNLMELESLGRRELAYC